MVSGANSRVGVKNSSENKTGKRKKITRKEKIKQDLQGETG